MRDATTGILNALVAADMPGPGTFAFGGSNSTPEAANQPIAEREAISRQLSRYIGFLVELPWRPRLPDA